MVATVLFLAAVAPITLPAGAPAGRVVALHGEVAIARDGASTPVHRGDRVYPGDVITTGRDGVARLLMTDKSVLALTETTSLKIAAYDVEPQVKRRRARLTVLVGRLWALVSTAVHPDASYEVTTGNAVAGVRGTELVLDVDAAGSGAITVIEGEVKMAASGAEKTLGDHESGSVDDAGGIDLGATSEEAIAEIRAAVRPEQELDRAAAEARLRAARKKGAGDEEGIASLDVETGEAMERDDPGTGDSVFEDAAAKGPNPAENIGDRLFDPSIMARVRVHAEVRP